MNFRSERSFTIRLGDYGINIGWECTRPFVSIDKYDDGCPERLATYGGCRIVNGPGCEWECDGCFAINAAGWSEDPDNESSVEDWDAFIETVVHNKRCASLHE